MKAFLILSSLIFLLSCGAEVPRADQSFKGVGNYITQDESLVLSENERNKLTSICSALGAKESYFRSLVVNNTVNATYTQASSVCDASESSSDANIEIVLENSELQFVANGGSDPLFKYVEGSSNGTLEDFCDAIDSDDDIKKQIASGQSLLIVNILASNSSQCSGDDIDCLTVEYAFKTDDGRYRVEQAVKLSINTDDSDRYRGMVSKKEFVGLCSTDSSKKTKKTMTLKSIN